MNAIEKQVGGEHYKKFKIQPITFIIENNLDFCQGNVIKYTCRAYEKGGIEDIDKAIHYLEFMKEKAQQQK